MNATMAVLPNPPPDHSAGEDSAYRTYLIGTSGRITTSIAIDAPNDAEAIKQAEAIDHFGTVELWDRGRIVLRRAGSKPRFEGEP